MLQRPGTDDAFDAVRVGARRALLTLVLASITFPSFNQLGITAVMGVLMAIGCAPDAEPDAGAVEPGATEARAAGAR